MVVYKVEKSNVLMLLIEVIEFVCMHGRRNRGAGGGGNCPPPPPPPNILATKKIQDYKNNDI